MKFLSEEEYRQIEKNRPHINNDSFLRAMEDIHKESYDFYADTAVEPEYVIVAAAIHEFSYMINEHIAEMYRTFLERTSE